MLFVERFSLADHHGSRRLAPFCRGILTPVRPSRLEGMAEDASYYITIDLIITSILVLGIYNL